MKSLFLILLLASTPAISDDVIDLGSLEIDGESRRPMINYSSSSLNIMKAMTTQLGNEKKRFAASLMPENIEVNGPSSFQFSDIKNEVANRAFKFSALREDI